MQPLARYKKCIANALLATSLILAHVAAFAGTTQRGKVWVGGDLDGALSPSADWHYNLFVQSRFGNDDSKFEQFFLRPSIYYFVNKQLRVWLGYDYIPTVSRNRTSAMLEQRVWPQVQYTMHLAPGNALNFRTRLEVRWWENSSQIAPRLRQRIEYSIPNVIKPDITFDIFDELFITLRNADWVAPQTINQNRIFIGFVMPLNKHTALDVGYMNIFRPRSGQNSMDHVLVFALSLDAQQVDTDTLLAI